MSNVEIIFNFQIVYFMCLFVLNSTFKKLFFKIFFALKYIKIIFFKFFYISTSKNLKIQK